MREANSMSVMRCVGVNPVLAWGRIRIVPGSDPVLEHGLGVSATVVDGKLSVQIDHGIRPRFWTPLATVVGSTDAVFVESFDEAAGSFVVSIVPPPEEPTEEPPPADPPEEEPEEPPPEEEEPEEEPVALLFEPTPVSADGDVFVSFLILGVGQ